MGWHSGGELAGFCRSVFGCRVRLRIQVTQVVSVLILCSHPLHPILFGRLLRASLFAGSLAYIGVGAGSGLGLRFAVRS